MDAEDKGKATRVWVTVVPVSDFEKALAFYRDLLGLPVRLDARSFDWMEVGPDEPLTKIGLSLRKDLGKDGAEARWTGIVLEADDFDAFCRRLKDHGVRFTTEPMMAPWGGRLADFLDPDGNQLQVVHDPGHYAAGRARGDRRGEDARTER